MEVFRDHGLAGLVLARPKQFRDHRGLLVKTYSPKFLQEMGLSFIPREVVYTESAKNVIRGMHFQVPPMAADKIVYVSAGSILDVTLDLRKKSPSFGKFHSQVLDVSGREMLYIPAGLAHGYLTLQEGTIVNYLHGEIYSEKDERGIAYDSFGMDWRITEPVLSAKDSRLCAFRDFISPF